MFVMVFWLRCICMYIFLVGTCNIYIYIYIYSKDMTNEKNEFYYVLINDFTVLILSAISFM